MIRSRSIGLVIASASIKVCICETKHCVSGAQEHDFGDWKKDKEEAEQEEAVKKGIDFWTWRYRRKIRSRDKEKKKTI